MTNNDIDAIYESARDQALGQRGPCADGAGKYEPKHTILEEITMYPKTIGVWTRNSTHISNGVINIIMWGRYNWDIINGNVTTNCRSIGEVEMHLRLRDPEINIDDFRTLAHL